MSTVIDNFILEFPATHLLWIETIMIQELRNGLLGACLLIFTSSSVSMAANWEVGLSRVDITPTMPLRLSGYGSRTKPSEGVDTPLNVRCMAMRTAGQEGSEAGKIHLLLSVDTIGFPGVLTSEILKLVQKKHPVSRERFVICGTHTHTAPHIPRGLINLFSIPVTKQEDKNLAAYTNTVRDQCVAAVDLAIASLKPARIFNSIGEVTFADNRRVIKDGVWRGFGVNPSGPVDHTLPVLKITSPDGKSIHGLIFNYACHCTTFGGNHNRINGDWAGFAARKLEKEHPGIVALCTIGCGADANPPRDPKKAMEYCQIEGEEIAEEIHDLLKKKWSEITAPSTPHFGFAGLPIDRPSVADMQKALKSPRLQVRNHARVMLDIYKKKGRMAESYPMPIQTWRFGDQFTMIFLGGEVCVDYALRIKKEFGANTWVTAYANDVFAYVAPERMRKEGGYEVDFSMIYYLQPGRWSSGTEEVIMKRIHELYEGKNLDEPLSLEESLKSFTVPKGYHVEVVAAEPLIVDPVNFAVGADGRLWVAEMSDYPRGKRDQQLPKEKRKTFWDGPADGKIKVLSDTNGDGKYDKAVVFAKDLGFPNGVYPWNGGVLVTVAPDIIFLKDTTGDGKADHRELLYTGFAEDNPQHRISGFSYALNHSLHLGNGHAGGVVTCLKTGDKINMSGRDVCVYPDSGKLETVSGSSQYGRCRDDFGNWFGNSNSTPVYQYVIEDRDLKRNPFVASPSPRNILIKPAIAPPVYPTSRTADRFNDLWAANRFTSACSPWFFRDSIWGKEAHSSVFICEPVHNLVSRVVVEYPGITATVHRAEGEEKSEVFCSTDSWSRPSWIITGPDSSLWIADMYRRVIEHPQWIPEAWQERVDLYAGSDKGRIYRLVKDSVGTKPIPNLKKMTDEQLVAQLLQPNGWLRDTAQRLLIERKLDPKSKAFSLLVAQLKKTDTSVESRIQSLWTATILSPKLRKQKEIRELFLKSDQIDLVRHGVKVFGAVPAEPKDDSLEQLASHENIRVRYELALAIGNAPVDSRRAILSQLAAHDAADPWMRAAILSSSVGVAGQILVDLFNNQLNQQGRVQITEALIATALGNDFETHLKTLLSLFATPKVQTWQLSALRTLLDSLDRKKAWLTKLMARDDAELQRAIKKLNPLFEEARHLASGENSVSAQTIPNRLRALHLLGRGITHRQEDIELLSQFLTAAESPELQIAAIESLQRLGRLQEIIEGLPNLASQPHQTAQAVLLSNTQGVKLLLAALTKKELNPADLSAASRSMLIVHKDAAIRKQAQQLLSSSPNEKRADVLQKFEKARTLAGDVAHGQEIFKKQCANCHKHQNIGTEFGPKLSALQDKSVSFLFPAILDPNRSVDARYRSWTAVTKQGKQVVGMIAEETATSITIAQADGRKITILRNDLEFLKSSTLSFMPEGLEKDITPQDLADVMSFIRKN